MSSLLVHPPVPRRIPRLYLILGAVLFAAALAASLGAKPSIRVTVDGAARRVGPGTTIGDIAEAGYLQGRPGRMISIRGRILARQSGAPARVWRNGRPVRNDRIVYDGDVITSEDGRNLAEEMVTKRDSIAFSKDVIGSGPLMTLAATGSPGVRQRTMGAISGEVVRSTVLVAPSPMVVKRYGTRPGEKVVALTFDDGPWPGQTDKVLHVLRQYDVKASFFMLGYMAEKYPALARRVAAEGHVIGNHTMGHRTLTELTASELDEQIDSGQSVLKASTGQRSDWFRPPGGHVSPMVWSRVRRAGLTVALWDVDPQDWRGSDSWEIAHDVAIHVKPGSIVLLHDGGGDRTQTIRALPVIIRSLRSRGYRFVTLDDMTRP